MQWLNMTNGKSTNALLIYRALHRVDENSGTAQLQEALGPHHLRPAAGHLHTSHSKQVRCERIRRKQEFRALDNQRPRRKELLLGDLLHRGGITVSGLRTDLLGRVP